jgi:hypothetical protein
MSERGPLIIHQELPDPPHYDRAFVAANEELNRQGGMSRAISNLALNLEFDDTLLAQARSLVTYGDMLGVSDDEEWNRLNRFSFISGYVLAKRAADHVYASPYVLRDYVKALIDVQDSQLETFLSVDEATSREHGKYLLEGFSRRGIRAIGTQSLMLVEQWGDDAYAGDPDLGEAFILGAGALIASGIERQTKVNESIASVAAETILQTVDFDQLLDELNESDS